MTDFFMRLAERILGQALTIQPVIAPVFAPGSDRVDYTVPDEEEIVYVSEQIASEGVTKTVSKVIGTTPSHVEYTGGDQPGTSVEAQFAASAPYSRQAPFSFIDARPLERLAGSPNPVSDMPPDAGYTASAALPTHELVEESRRVTSISPTPVEGDKQRLAALREVATAAVLRSGAALQVQGIPAPEEVVEESPDTTPRTEFLARPGSVREEPSMSDRLPAPQHVPARAAEKRRAQPQPAEAQMLEPDPVPTVQVTIGRVEVRATPAPATASRPRQQQRPAPPVMGLEEYLRRRSEGGS